MVKHQLGLRQFLLRGPANVTREWLDDLLREQAGHGPLVALTPRPLTEFPPTVADGPGARASPSPVGP